MMNRASRLELEHLEDRCSPSDLFGFTRIEIAAPPNLVDPGALWSWIKLEAFLGQWPGQGIPYQPGLLLQLDLTPAQSLWWGLTGTVGREVVPIGDSWTRPGGELPVILASPGNYGFSSGTVWEETALRMGWWYQDWDGAAAEWNSALMPPGPQYGQAFAAPNYQLADALLMQGNPYWWYFV